MGGAYFASAAALRVHATANAHPITAGMKPFIVNDEQHYIDYDRTALRILESENLDGLT